jgi:hypothetical protein
MSSDVTKMYEQYKQHMAVLDPESSTEMDNLIASGTLVEPTPATLASWTKTAAGYAVQKNRLNIADRLKGLHEEAVNITDVDDIGSEISGLYNCAFEFKNAELNLEAVAKLSEKKEKESVPLIDYLIDGISSTLRNTTIRSFGMLTSTVKDFKDNVLSKLKGTAKAIKSGLEAAKDLFVDTFNKAAKFLFRIINEFASKIFSFIDMIKKLGKTKGYGLKSVTISFDPPAFGSVNVLGFSVPIPKVSLPMLEVDFEISSEDAENGYKSPPDIREDPNRDRIY